MNSTNPRSDCPYCDKNFLCRKLGHHIFENHLDVLFSESTPTGKKNRYNLHTSTTPLATHFTSINMDDAHYWCLGCHSCIKRKEMTKKHLKDPNCMKLYEETLSSLRESFPKSKTVIETQPSLQPSRKLKNTFWELLKENYMLRTCLLLHKKEITISKEEISLFGFGNNAFEVPLETLLDLDTVEDDFYSEFTDKDDIQICLDSLQIPVEEVQQFKDNLLTQSRFLLTEKTVKEEKPVEEPVKEPEPVKEDPVKQTKRRAKSVIEKPVESKPVIPAPLPPPPVIIPEPKSKLGLINPSSFVPKKDEPVRPNIVMNTKLPKQQITRDSLLNSLTPAQRRVFEMTMTEKDINSLLSPI